MAEKIMTMHQVLAELKVLDSRINKALNVGLIASYKGEPTEEEKEASINTMKSAYDSVTHLIANKKALEIARAHSNDTTIVKVGNKEYTVSEAIKRKHTINYEKMLLQQMVDQLNRTKRDVDNKNAEVERSKQNYALRSYEATKTEADSNDLSLKLQKIAELEAKFVKENSYSILDPLKLEEKIVKLEKEISDFEVNVDAALSVSNAVTSVTVQLLD